MDKMQKKKQIKTNSLFLKTPQSKQQEWEHFVSTTMKERWRNSKKVLSNRIIYSVFYGRYSKTNNPQSIKKINNKRN
jgi:ribosomal protein S7